MPRKRTVAAYLLIALMVTTMWIGNQFTGLAAPERSTTAIIQNMKAETSACKGVTTYAKAVTKVLTTTPEGKWFMAFLDDDAEDWSAMSPEDLIKTEKNIRLVIADFKKIKAPPVAADFHDDLIKVLELYANVFHTAQTSWLAVAVSGYVDTITTVGARFTKESKALQATCGPNASGGI
jgi:hypothetical protein